MGMSFERRLPAGRNTPLCLDCRKPKEGRTAHANRCFACQYRHRQRTQKRYWVFRKSA